MAGFECEFVEKPPKVVQFKCPICLLVLRDPYQATCCGKSFCKECIHRIKFANQVCPTCNDKDFNLFHNKGLQQSLYDFRVYCTHKSKSCEWTGELRDLDNHLNSDPSADKALQGCLYTSIKCPLSCIGCEVKLPRNDMKIHMNNNVLDHFLKQTSQVNALKEQLITYEQENQHMKQRISHLEEKNTELEGQLAALTVNREVRPPGLVDFTLTNYQQHKQNNDKWYSDPFYSHFQGYKMCIEVVANGWATGNGTDLSVFVHLMIGEFDSFLKWPFRGEVTIHLLDPNEDGCYYTKIITYSNDTGDECAARVTNRSKKWTRGHGSRKFIPHTELERKYVKNDCIMFRVKKVIPNNC